MFVYAMRNPAMPGLYKVGFSAEPSIRAASLSSASGIPMPFEIIHFVDCMTERQARRAEALAHFILEYSRVSDSREFFRLGHENICVHAIIVGAFCAWRPDRQPHEWAALTAELANWPLPEAQQ